MQFQAKSQRQSISRQFLRTSIILVYISQNKLDCDTVTLPHLSGLKQQSFISDVTCPLKCVFFLFPYTETQAEVAIIHLRFCQALWLKKETLGVSN